MKKLSSNIPKAMRLYGKYVLEVLNDKIHGDELLDKARNLHNAN
jgi:hypothetical protein